MSNCLSIKCNKCLIGFICSLEVKPYSKKCKLFEKRLKEKYTHTNYLKKSLGLIDDALILIKNLKENLKEL